VRGKQRIECTHNIPWQERFAERADVSCAGNVERQRIVHQKEHRHFRIEVRARTRQYVGRADRTIKRMIRDDRVRRHFELDQ